MKEEPTALVTLVIKEQIVTRSSRIFPGTVWFYFQVNFFFFCIQPSEYIHGLKDKKHGRFKTNLEKEE